MAYRRYGVFGQAAWAACYTTLGVAALAATGVPATAQTAEPPAATAPDPFYERARTTFEALADGTRVAIQDALVWTGDSVSASDGVFGRRSFEAIQAFQRRTRQSPTGMLDRDAMAALLAVAARARDAAGFTPTDDPATGTRLGVPLRLLPRLSRNPAGGSRFQSQDGKVTLDTRTLPGDEEALREMYDKALAVRTPGRSVTARLFRPGLFVVTGETEGGKFSMRFAHKGETIRGFTIGYDKARAPEIDRIALAIANSFVPFPVAAGEARTPSPQSRPGVAAASPSGVTFTGWAAGPRRIVTAFAATESCRDPLVDGASARIVSRDPARGLALLEPARPRATVPLSVRSAQPQDGGGDDGALVAFLGQEPGQGVMVAPAPFVAPDRIVAPLQEGAAGAVILDRTGRIAGLVVAPALGARRVAGLLPPANHPVVRSADLVAFLGQDAPKAQEGAPKTAAAAASLLAPALVRVTCAANPTRP